MLPKIIVFDIDGTLTDSVRQHQIAFEAALHSYDFPALRTDWGSYKHHSDSAILAEAWEDSGWSGEADLAQLEREFALHYDRAVDIEPVSEIVGASRFLASLQELGWVKSICDGKPAPWSASQAFNGRYQWGRGNSCYSL